MIVALLVALGVFLLGCTFAVGWYRAQLARAALDAEAREHAGAIEAAQAKREAAERGAHAEQADQALAAPDAPEFDEAAARDLIQGSKESS